MWREKGEQTWQEDKYGELRNKCGERTGRRTNVERNVWRDNRGRRTIVETDM